MTKIKLPTLKNELDKKIELYKSIMPDLSESFDESLIKLKDLISIGILQQSNYDLFKNNDHNFNLNMALGYFREEYIRQYGFFIVSDNFINIMKEHFFESKILEVGAGSGFLSYCLQNEGIQITPTDKKIEENNYGFKQTYTEIIETDSVNFLKKNPHYDTILMSWPNYNSNFADNVLKHMSPGQTLIYIGEGYGGCTANDNFYDRLESKAQLDTELTNKFSSANFSWFGIHDKIRVYKITN